MPEFGHARFKRGRLEAKHVGRGVLASDPPARCFEHPQNMHPLEVAQIAARLLCFRRGGALKADCGGATVRVESGREDHGPLEDVAKPRTLPGQS